MGFSWWIAVFFFFYFQFSPWGDPRPPRLRVARFRNPDVATKFTQAISTAQTASDSLTFATFRVFFVMLVKKHYIGFAFSSRPDRRYGHEYLWRNATYQPQRTFIVEMKSLSGNSCRFGSGSSTQSR